MAGDMVLASDLTKAGTWSREVKAVLCLAKPPGPQGGLSGAHWQPCSSLGRDSAVSGTVGLVSLGLSRSPHLSSSPVPQHRFFFLEAERSLQPGVWLSCVLWYSEVPTFPAWRIGEKDAGCLLLTGLRRKMTLLKDTTLLGPRDPWPGIC